MQTRHWNGEFLYSLALALILYLGMYHLQVFWPTLEPVHAAPTQTSSWTWNIQPGTGNDLNCGAFITGATGTDHSTDATPFITVDGATVTGSVATTTVTFTGVTLTTAITGNCINIPTGLTGVTAGAYSLTYSNATQATIAGSAGTGSLTGSRIGGTFNTINGVMALYKVNDMRVYLKNAGSPISIGTTQTLNCPTNGFTSTNSQIIGYNATPGDNPTLANRPVLQATAAVPIFTIGGTSACTWVIRNFILDGNAGTGTQGITAGSPAMIWNTEVRNFSDDGVISNFTYAGNSGLNVWPVWGYGLYLHGNNISTGIAQLSGISPVACSYCRIDAGGAANLPAVSVTVGSGPIAIGIDHSIISNVGGTSPCLFGAASVSSNGASVNLDHNDIRNCGGDGLKMNTKNMTFASRVRYNIFSEIAGYGINYAGNVGYTFFPNFNPNAYYSNTTGKSNLLDTGTAAPKNDLFLGCDPFTNAAANDFTLSRSCLATWGTAIPGTIYPATVIGASDYGAMQALRVFGGMR